MTKIEKITEHTVYTVITDEIGFNEYQVSASGKADSDQWQLMMGMSLEFMDPPQEVIEEFQEWKKSNS